MTQCEFILFVHDQHRSREFYSGILQLDPVLDVTGMTEFKLFPNCKLGLLQQDNALRILNYKTPHPEEPHGTPRCEFYLTVDDPAVYLRKALNAGAGKVSDPELKNWGDVVAYCTDPDGHVIAFAKKGLAKDG